MLELDPRSRARAPVRPRALLPPSLFKLKPLKRDGAITRGGGAASLKFAYINISYSILPPPLSLYPSKVWQRFLDDPAPGPRSESYFAVVMIADISGFTKLTHWLDRSIEKGQVGGGSGGDLSASPPPLSAYISSICARGSNPARCADQSVKNGGGGRAHALARPQHRKGAGRWRVTQGEI